MWVEAHERPQMRNFVIYFWRLLNSSENSGFVLTPHTSPYHYTNLSTYKIRGNPTSLGFTKLPLKLIALSSIVRAFAKFCRK